MSSIADYLENKLLDHIFNNVSYPPPATVYVGLSTADPLDDASGLAEPGAGGYGRKAVVFNAAAARKIVQNGDVLFDQATGSWGICSHWGVFDAASGGNMMAHGEFSTAKTVNSGNIPKILDAEMEIEVLAGDMSNYLANALLDFAFRNQAFSSPDTYVALCTATVADADTGSTITEPAGYGYGRKQVNPNGGASPTWDLAAAGALANTHEVGFSDPTGSWGTIIDAAIVDSVTDGNLLFYDNAAFNEQPDDGDPVAFPVGGLEVSLS